MLSKTWFKILAVAAVAVIVFIAGSFGWLDWPKSAALRLATPVIRPITHLTLGVQGFFHSLATIREQVRERDVLFGQVKKQEAEIALLEQYREENARLRRILGLKENSGFTTTAAALVSRDPSGATGMQLIDRGSNDGLKAGNAVLDEWGNLLGVVRHVYAHNAEFVLVTDGSLKIDAEVPSRQALGIITGSHILGMKFDLVSQDANLEKGDRVVTSGLSESIPKGLLVGYIDEVQSSNSELFKKLSVAPAAQIRNFKFVLVITSF
jgi:rod shape-determining protein MreC